MNTLQDNVLASVVASADVRDRTNQTHCKNQDLDSLVNNLTVEEIQEKSIVVARYNPGGLYFLLNGVEIVYVGKSTTAIGARIVRHVKDGVKDFDRYFILPIPDASPSELLESESQAIAKFCPKYNAVISSCKTHVLKSDLEVLYGLKGYLVQRLIQRGLLTPVKIQRSIVLLRLEVEKAVEWCLSVDETRTRFEARHCIELARRQSAQENANHPASDLFGGEA